jgi:hypothetical protein
MIDYRLFRFAAARGTGVFDFMNACRNSGVTPVGGYTAADPVAFFVDGGTNLKVSLVRHPCDYLATYLMTVVDVDKETTVRRYLDFCPGIIGSRLLAYAADSYIRCEWMNPGFYDLLTAYGIPHGQIRPPINAPKIRWPLSRDIYDQVMRAEREMAEMFDYY